MTGSREAYVALALTPGIGLGRLRRLLAACGSADGALAAPFEFLCAVKGISPAAASAVRAARADAGARVLAQAEALGASVLLPGDPAFPAALSTIPQPPALLFALGNLDLLTRPAVAVVGSRDHTAYGEEACRRVAAEAVSGGLVVVSGMARGLDAVAHSAALDAGGDTIGVLGNGFGVIYPAANRQLYRRVAEQGLLLTEHPPGERPHAASFPRRNRLISGLAALTVVAEAAVGSGALITVESALEQGREVMAVPGPITSPMALGVNRLIRDGATPYLEPGDLLALFPGVTSRGPAAAPAAAPPPPAVPPGFERFCQALAGEVLPVDQVAERMDRPVAEVLAGLAEMELLGVVEQLPGWRFRRVGG